MRSVYLLLLDVLFTLTAGHLCPVYRTTAITHATTKPRTLTPYITTFLNNLGDANTGAVTFPAGHRHITWDDSLPFSTDGNFTNQGLLLDSKNSKLLHSNAEEISDDRFSSVIKSSLSRTFRRFSRPRLITPAKSNKLRATFTLPGTETPAGVSAFGAVFVDVDEPRRTWLWLKDADGCTIARVEVEVMDSGLSFVGVLVGDASRPLVTEVVVKLGSATIADSRKGEQCVDHRGDLVVLDDLFFAEPREIDVRGSRD